MAKKSFEKETVVKVDYNGKTPPYSESLEDTVLGQLLIDSDAISDVMNLLKKEVFFVPKNQIIYDAMFNIVKENNPVTFVTLVEKLQADDQLEKVGGLAHIADLTNKVSSAANIEHHAKLLVQKHIQRELIRASGQICEKAFDPTCVLSDLTDFAEREIMSITDNNIQRKSYQDVKTVANSVFNHIQEIKGKGEKFVGLESGFTELDKITSGWQKGNMIVIAARPGMGKTAFVISMIRNLAIKFGRSVAMFSLEMSCEQIVTRMFVGEAQVNQYKLQTGQLDDNEFDKLSTAMQRIEEAKIWLDDTAALSIYDFKSKCRKLKERHNVECIIVDYLQLMTASGAFSREQEVGTISRQIKETAMELQIPIIALAQLNRSIEGRTKDDKKPRLSDLRESGSIEQDADMVLFIHRKFKDGILTNIDGTSTEREADIVVAKNRHGSSGEARLEFIGDYMSFNNLQNNNFSVNSNAGEFTRGTTVESGINFDADTPFPAPSSTVDPFGGTVNPNETPF